MGLHPKKLHCLQHNLQPPHGATFSVLPSIPDLWWTFATCELANGKLETVENGSCKGNLKFVASATQEVTLAKA